MNSLIMKYHVTKKYPKHKAKPFDEKKSNINYK